MAVPGKAFPGSHGSDRVGVECMLGLAEEPDKNFGGAGRCRPIGGPRLAGRNRPPAGGHVCHAWHQAVLAVYGQRAGRKSAMPCQALSATSYSTHEIGSRSACFTTSTSCPSRDDEAAAIISGQSRQSGPPSIPFAAPVASLTS